VRKSTSTEAAKEKLGTALVSGVYDSIIGV